MWLKILINLKGFFSSEAGNLILTGVANPDTQYNIMFTLIILPLLSPVSNWPEIPTFGSTEVKTPT